MTMSKGFVIAIAAILASCATLADSEIVPHSAVQFQPLNPARGDASPQAGVLWGDIRRDVPSGAIIEFVDGFSSPPHIHNITYRGVVISGLVHNDDPDAAIQWMGPGSFWTQPAGETHITAAAKGSKATIFLQILSGPYLVQPPSEFFDNGERPLNLEARNMVWIDASDTTWLEPGADPTKGPKMVFLWGDLQDDKENGTLLHVPAGYSGEIRGSRAWLRAVVMRGPADHRLAGADESSRLEAGSYFGSNDQQSHQISCAGEDGCLIYVFTKGKYFVTQS